MSEKSYRLENNLIDVYFQKSSKFLYPLVAPVPTVQPVQVYMAWKDHYKLSDNRLICVFQSSDEVPFKVLKVNFLIHRLFECSKELEDSKVCFIFNLNKHSEDLMHFHEGRYSLLSKDLKYKILKHFAVNKCSAEYMDSYLNPEKYFERYAELLNVDEQLLKDIGELCDPYNPLKEVLCLKEAGMCQLV